MLSGRAARASGCLLALLALIGCGDSSMGEVRGTVKVDGQLVKEGAITFTPVNGKTATAGAEIKEGRYATRVPLGEMKVATSVPKVTRKKKIYPTENSPEMEMKDEALPPKYNAQTELRFEVKAGTNEKDFDLQGK
ncbi:MAG TPA: hypothetical protein VEL76_10655 [Gemmataceae bacterium]|nr:hypothetical protein [Gemmataceae bacterium]